MRMINYLESTYGPVMTPDQIAEVLHCHPSHVRQLCQKGELPAVQVGKRWFVATFQFAALVDPSGQVYDEC